MSRILFETTLFVDKNSRKIFPGYFCRVRFKDSKIDQYYKQNVFSAPCRACSDNVLQGRTTFGTGENCVTSHKFTQTKS